MSLGSWSERDVCTKRITPAIEKAGWDIQLQVREEYGFTAGRILVQGRKTSRGPKRRADFVLFYKPNLPLALIEAKDQAHSVGSGMQQALEYADSLDVPFVFSSNGEGFLFHDRTGTGDAVETQLTLEQFPSPDELWQRYCQWKGLDAQARQTVQFPYFDDGSSRSPRYYQANAINRTIEAVARGQDRILLVMATGTGKTYTAFQIIWRLWKSRQKKRILFLADRNNLVDQARNNDFKPFGQAMTKISKRQIDTSYEIYLSLYQAVTGNDDEKNIYKQFSPDFFDLIVVDECHRGSAAEDSAWREILEYFSSATHIGLTATPKETREVSNTLYFGEPVYTYSLKQGIEDGFLAPYKVVRVDFDRDLQGWRPTKGMVDKNGVLIDDRIYTQSDMDRNLVMEPRTLAVAKRVTDYLKATDPYQKTIIFCDDIDHAERMRQALVNLNPERIRESRRYVTRITGDAREAQGDLDDFINPESRYPVIATTSKLMTTGTDSQTCKLIVLDQHIKSMTEFKQMIGRGTRILESYGKYWFTIMDFKKATELFADPAFDGEPVQIYNPDPDEPPVPPDEDGRERPDQPGGDDGTQPGGTIETDPDKPGRVRYVVDNVTVSVIAERVQYYGPDGKLITESLQDYTRSKVKTHYNSMSEFIARWKQAQSKQALLEELKGQGVLWEQLAEDTAKRLGKQLDPLDLIGHVVFDQPAMTRQERADALRRRGGLTAFPKGQQDVLDALVDKYVQAGIEHIEDIRILQLPPFSAQGSVVELIGHFGGRGQYLQAVKQLQDALYE